MWSTSLKGIGRRLSGLPNALFPLVYAIIGGAIIAVVERAASHAVVNTYAGLQIALLVVVGIIIYTVRLILSRIDDLHKRSKLAVDYYRTPTDALTAAQRLVESLQEDASLRVVNSFVEADTSANKSVRRLWYGSIEERLGRIHYHRVIQLAERDVRGTSGRSLYQFVSAVYADHFRNTLLIRRDLKNSRHITRIDAVPARYPITFGIFQNPGSAPGGTLYFQVNEYAPTDDDTVVWSVAGAFVIRDPDGQLVPHFESLFTTLANSDGLRGVALDELGTPADSD
jgi:hypothetical protein